MRFDMDPMDAVVWYIVFVVSVTAHEGAHALAAYWGGDSTAYNAGQVSLNPVPHMQREPWGMVLVPIVSVFTLGWPLGWASTPYDPNWEQRYPRRAAWMAAAGPAANLGIALLVLVALWLGIAWGVFFAPDQANFSRMVVADTQLYANLGRFLSMMLTLNTILFLFNLVPVPPLDGSSVITLVLSEYNAMRWKEMLQSGGVASVGLLAAWFAFPYIVRPMFSLLLILLHPSVTYG